MSRTRSLIHLWGAIPCALIALLLGSIGIASLLLGMVILRFPPSHLPDRKVLIRGFGLIAVGMVLTVMAAFRAGG